MASRAHHADVGGTYPGSMGPCREIYQEGLRIPPVKIMREGKIVADVLALLLNNVRTPEEREGDLGAQIAACQTGARRLAEICARYGLARTKRALRTARYSEEMMCSFLGTVPAGASAEDFLDNDGIEDKPVRIVVTLRSHRHRAIISKREAQAAIAIDFTGSISVRARSMEAITVSACFYVFRCLLRGVPIPPV
jgi:N-methylhydantoinase B